MEIKTSYDFEIHIFDDTAKSKLMNKLQIILFMAWVVTHSDVSGQHIARQIEAAVDQNTIEGHIRFLAADELAGRMTGTAENAIAAKYIAEQLRSYGVKMAPGQRSYWQPVPLRKDNAPTAASLALADTVISQWDQLLFLTTVNGDMSADIVYVNYGLGEDLKGVDLVGKIVIARAGAAGENNPRAFFGLSREKSKAVAEAGGLALIELYRSSEIPWSLLKNYFSGTKFNLDLSVGTGFTSGLINDASGYWVDYFSDKQARSGKISIEGAASKTVEVPNVIGWIEGTDPVLKDEYLIISAHFDHVGVKPVAAGEDSIYNGARDNAIGTTALLTTAKFFASNPQGRSIVFLACNAEEVGLLGSRYYADNPWFPLDKAIFNFNNDGAGYNDITKMTVIGLERTSAESMIVEAANAFGLTAIKDPVPEHGLFDRSDNVSFAAKGIPAINASPGMTAFDAEVLKYYHQASDEPETLDFAYLTTYYRAYLYAAYQLLNATERPFWNADDKYEEAGKALYGRP